ncbi:MAG: sigma-70 family RNA polymerase sigma factor [Planctomycetota bacterium]
MSEWTPDVARLCAFDDAEWARVERAYTGRLLAYIARRVPDPEAREDVVQEVFLGAVRGIQRFDASFTFEQYLFGICRNRTIDHLRRRAVHGVGVGEGDDGTLSEADGASLEDVPSTDASPSRLVRANDLAEHGRALLADVLRDWVQETWAAGEFKRLMVVEALFRGGWRNRDTWERFGLRDETAIAGVKFRALKRMRALAVERDSGGGLTETWADDEDAAPRIAVDVAAVWASARVSCPARHWLARALAGTLPTEPDGGPAAFVGFHVDELGCDECQANRDDLARQDEATLEPLLASLRASTMGILRSRTLP